MANGRVKRYFAMGENPVVGSMNGPLQRNGLRKLDWLVVRDFQITETADFWREPPEIQRMSRCPRRFQSGSYGRSHGRATLSERCLTLVWKCSTSRSSFGGSSQGHDPEDRDRFCPIVFACRYRRKAFVGTPPDVHVLAWSFFAPYRSSNRSGFRRRAARNGAQCLARKSFYGCACDYYPCRYANAWQKAHALCPHSDCLRLRAMPTGHHGRGTRVPKRKHDTSPALGEALSPIHSFWAERKHPGADTTGTSSLYPSSSKLPGSTGAR